MPLAPAERPADYVDRIGFVLRLARAMHAAGTPAHRLEELLIDAATRLGIEGNFFTTPTSIFASFGAVERQQTHLIRVEPGTLNLGQLGALDKIARDVDDGRLSVAEASRQVDAVLASKSKYRWWLIVLASGLVSAAGCRFLGGGLAEIRIAAVAGLAVGALGRGFAHLTLPGSLYELAASFLGAGIVLTAAALGIQCAVSTTILASVIIILPGLTMTLAMTEIASRHLASGTARLSGAFMVFIEMAVGIAVATAIVSQLAGSIPTRAVIPLPVWTRTVALAAMPLGFCILLGARRRDYFWIYAVSVVAYLGMQAGQRALGAELGAAVGSFAAGIAANAYERGRFGPATVTLLPGVLLLVPGSIGFLSVTALLDAHTEAGIETAFRMVLTATALAAGLLVANLVLPPGRARTQKPN